ncbi:MAG: caspase family protein [Bacillota bacterium]|nr:caspase family protein [Bacillota bacterium]
MFRKSGIILRLAVALALLAGALALTGCFGGGGGISVYGSIDGYVYYHADARGTGDSGAAKPEMVVTRSSKAPSGYLPLQGAKVVAVQAGKITYSNSRGYFILTSLSPGVYDVSITHERFINGLTYPGVQVVAGWTTHLGDAKLGSFFYLIIGINNYPGEENDLQYAVADAQLLEETLWGANGYAGEVVRLTDANAKKADIFSAIREIGAKMSPNGQDYFVMTFSGHGGYQQDPNPNPEPPGDDPQEYLVASDGEVITDDELTTWIQDYIPTNFCLFVFDSCHSGGMVKGGPLPASAPAWMKNLRPGLSGLARDLNKYGYVVLMASDDDEVSYEDPNLDSGHGVFTYYLCEGITTGGADTNPPDTFISAQEVFDYVQPRVVDHTRGYPHGVQTPQLYAEPLERADIPIYRAP